MSYIHRTALVTGVSNHKSLAWSSALCILKNRTDFRHVIVTYHNERFGPLVKELVRRQNDKFKQDFMMFPSEKTQQQQISCYPCDIINENDIKKLCERIPSLISPRATFDAVIHSIAYAPPTSMKDSTTSLPLLNTSKYEYNQCHEISAYSLITLSKYMAPLLIQYARKNNTSSSITALTYIGSTRFIPNYNIMGSAKASLEALIRGLAYELGPSIRCNAVSSGPVNTLASRGINNFIQLKKESKKNTFLKRNVTKEEVGNVVAFLADGNDGGSGGMTGQVVYCDAGYSSYG